MATSFKEILASYTRNKIINPRQSAQALQGLANQGSFGAALTAGLLNFQADQADRQDSVLAAALQGEQLGLDERRVAVSELTAQSNARNADARTNLTNRQVANFDEDAETIRELNRAKTAGQLADTTHQRLVNGIYEKYADDQARTELNSKVASIANTEARTADIPLNRQQQQRRIDNQESQFATTSSQNQQRINNQQDQFSRSFNQGVKEFGVTSGQNQQRINNQASQAAALNAATLKEAGISSRYSATGGIKLPENATREQSEAASDLQLLKDVRRQFNKQPLLGIDNVFNVAGSDRYTAEEQKRILSYLPARKGSGIGFNQFDPSDDEEVDDIFDNAFFRLKRTLGQ